MGRGWVGTKDPPPPYFWVEKLKKRGIRVIRDSGRAQLHDLGPDLGLVLGLVSACFCVLQLMPCGAEYPCRCHLCVSDYFCGQHCHKITDVYLSSGVKVVSPCPWCRYCAVVGAVEQKPGGRLILKIMPKLDNGKMRQKGPPTAAEIRPFAAAFVHPGAAVYTDGARAYEVLAREFSWDHRAVSHKKGEWVRQEGNKKVHTNKIDGMWAHVRGFINARCGLRKHRLQWYLREFEWRHNTEGCLFASMCALIEKRGFMATPNRWRTLNHGPYRRTPTSDTKVAPKRALSAARAPKAKRRL